MTVCNCNTDNKPGWNIWYEEDETAYSATPEHGTLYDYQSGEEIRAATPQELSDSREQAKSDGGAGVIDVDGRSCYVTEG